MTQSRSIPFVVAMIIVPLAPLAAGAVRAEPQVAAAASGPGNGNGEASQPPSEVAWLRGILATPGADAAVRLGAAQRLFRLAASDSPLAEPAEAALREALRSGDEARAVAIIDAVRTADAELRDGVSRSLATALLDSAQSAPTARRESLRTVFAGLGEEAALAFGAIAADRQAELGRRQLALWALESMSHRSATESLVGLLDHRRGIDQSIRQAACDALERNLQLGFNRDESRWRDWWLREAGGRRDDSVLEGLRRRLAEWESRFADQEQERARLEARLASLYGEIYLGLDPAQRQERTARLLLDELPVVRLYALGLVDRMLRNFESPGEAIQDAMLQRLDPAQEPSAETRIRTLALLESIRRPDFAERVTPFFVKEQSSRVLAAYLSAFQQQPAVSDAAFDRLVALLEDQNTSPAIAEEVARALVRLGDVAALGADRMARLRPIAESLEPRLVAPAFVRLAGAVAEESMLDRLEALLDSPDRAIRRAAAEVMRQRGRLEPLARRALDEAVYPVAIRALADPPSSAEHLRRILAWTPPTEAAAKDRAEVVAQLAASLPLAEMLAADDLLLAEPWAGETYRLDILDRAVKRASESNGSGAGATAGGAAGSGTGTGTGTGSGTAVPSSVLVRLGGLLVGDDARRLQSIVDRLAGSQEPGVEDLRFAAAVTQQQYDLAEQLRPDPTAWLDLLERLVERGSAAAPPLNDEMARRFQAELSPDQASRLKRAADTLRTRPTVG